MKIDGITQFLRNSTRHITLISKILSDLKSRSQELENELLHDYDKKNYSKGHFKVMATIDLDDIMTLKATMVGLTVQGLPCISILDPQLY